MHFNIVFTEIYCGSHIFAMHELSMLILLVQDLLFTVVLSNIRIFRLRVNGGDYTHSQKLPGKVAFLVASAFFCLLSK